MPGEASRSAAPNDLTAERVLKVRATFHLPADLVEELRNAVVALSGPPHRLTMAKLAENALRNELHRLEQMRQGRQRGRSFPQREGDVRTGRPIGS
ncbi:MAG TPA: hypothetical protein VOB72_13155 [Candidatus Dormibacteraeota bacterium]|nr:hypothetical protein [Candidatus Dormibacteraeota bacterium]